MSTSGLIRLLKAEAVVEETYFVTEETLVDKIDTINANQNDTKNDTDAVFFPTSETVSSAVSKNNSSSPYHVYDIITNETTNITSPNNTRILEKPTRRIVSNVEKKKTHRQTLSVVSYYAGRI